MKDYIGAHGVEYQEPKSTGWLTIRVLNFLEKQPWDQLALNFVHALIPNVIRVVVHNGEEKTDAWLGRVTVYLDKDKRIEKITQEVQVGLDGGYIHGADLYDKAKKRGIDSN